MSRSSAGACAQLGQPSTLTAATGRPNPRSLLLGLTLAASVSLVAVPASSAGFQGPLGHRCHSFAMFRHIDSSVPCREVTGLLHRWSKTIRHGGSHLRYRHWTCEMPAPGRTDRPGCVSSVIDGGLVLADVWLDGQ